MYLVTLVNDSAIQQEIESNKSVIENEFNYSFDIDQIYESIINNLDVFISEDSITESYDNIKNFALETSLDYLNTKSKELAQRG